MARSGGPRKRQTRLSFTPLPSSSPAAKGYNKQIQDRAAAVTLDGLPHLTRRRRREDTERQPDGVNDAMPTPAGTNRSIQAKDNSHSDNDSDDEPVRSTQRRQPLQRQLDFNNARDPSTFSSPIRLSSPPHPYSSATAGLFSTQTQRQKSAPYSSSDDSNDSDTLPSPRRLITRRSKRDNESNLKNDNTPQVRIGSKRENPVEVESDEEEDQMPTTLGTRRRKRRRVERMSSDDFIVSSPPQMQDSSEDDIEIIAKPRKRRNIATDQEEEEEEEEEEISPTEENRSSKKRKLSRREEEELAEDLDFLAPSSDEEEEEEEEAASPRRARSLQSASKNARQKALEALRRRRSQQSNGPNDRTRSESDDNDESDVGPLRSSQIFQADQDDEDFIDADGEEETALGIPEGLPLEFTHFAAKKPKDLFKYAVEWFVQKKINPAFQKNDAIYDLTFRKLDDEVRGLAGSKFKSSAWTSDFTASLNSRPDIAFSHIDRSDVEHSWRDTCDACNRSGHPPTFQVQFQGRPYHRETLEEVVDHDEDDDEDDNDPDESSSNDNLHEPSYDEQGRKVPPASEIYYLGKFCMSNAQTAHALHHWRYHLNDWVVNWLSENGYDRPEEVVKRDGWSTRKRRKYANKIADELEAQGVVKQLYRDYRKNIDEARESDGRRFR